MSSHWIPLKIVQGRPKAYGPGGPDKHGCRSYRQRPNRHLLVEHDSKTYTYRTLIVTDLWDLACYIKARRRAPLHRPHNHRIRQTLASLPTARPPHCKQIHIQAIEDQTSRSKGFTYQGPRTWVNRLCSFLVSRWLVLTCRNPKTLSP